MVSKVDKKVCGICKKIIFIPGDEYCILSQFNSKNKATGQGYYHVTCFKEKYIQQTNVTSMLERTNRLLAKAEGIYS